MVKPAARILLSLLFVGAGTMHFVNTEFFLAIMPPYVPWHLHCVYLSGFLEIFFGVFILLDPVRRAAGIGLAVLLVAVFPANVHMAVNNISAGFHVEPWMLWARLPLQAVLIAWALWATNEPAEKEL
jgi:uncharacterized membrane protein